MAEEKRGRSEPDGPREPHTAEPGAAKRARTEPSILDAAQAVQPPFQFASTKKTKVYGNAFAGGVAKRRTKVQYRQFLHLKTRKAR